MKLSASSARTEEALIQRLRDLCLGLPETSETHSWNHPNFRAGKRTFVAFERIDQTPTFAFRLPPSAVAKLLEQDDFFSPPYGRGQWVSLHAQGNIDWEKVENLVRHAYRTVALKRMIKELDS